MPSAQPLNGVQAKLTYAGRKFHAWWEGYAFDEAAERAALEARFAGFGSKGARPSEEIIAEAIWGEGRFEPGSPAWTMRFARLLSLPVKANVIVFGAAAGAPLEDLKHGTRWKISGLTRAENIARGNLQSYDLALQKLHKASAAGGVSFFELTKDPDPTAFARLAAELMLPGARGVFLDYTVARKGARLRGCFPTTQQGVPRTKDDYMAALRGGGFTIHECVDETRGFMPLIAEGWAGWRKAYAAISNIEDGRLRADLMRSMAVQAHLWAERFDAMKSGQLQVTRFQTSRD